MPVLVSLVRRKWLHVTGPRLGVFRRRHSSGDRRLLSLIDECGDCVVGQGESDHIAVSSGCGVCGHSATVEGAGAGVALGCAVGGVARLWCGVLTVAVISPSYPLGHNGFCSGEY